MKYLNRCLLVVILAAGFASGQEGPSANSAESDPIQCWWRTSAGAVRVGEIFQLVLTCSVLETEAFKVVPDQSPLDPSIVQMPPFEVTGGTRGADLHAPQHRFFQYEYQLRVISQDLFGRDAKLPEMKVSYRVQSRLNTGTAVEGIERSYVLPPLSIRVLSLVPADVSDIRDTSKVAFTDIESRAFWANVVAIIGVALIAVAIFLGILALARATRRRESEDRIGKQLVPDGPVLESTLAELEAIARDRQVHGWTLELVDRLLTSLRILAGYALRRRPAQIVADPGDDIRAGHLLIRYRRTRFARPANVLVAGSVTAQTISGEIGRLSSSLVAEHAAILGEIERALAVLTASRYGRDSAVTAEAMNSGLETGIRTARILCKEHTWLKRTLSTLRRTTKQQFGERVWAR